MKVALASAAISIAVAVGFSVASMGTVLPKTDPGFLSWLFDSSRWVTRDHCGVWGERHRDLAVAANLVTTVCYVLIPFGVLRRWHEWRNKHLVPRDADIGCGLFASFIFACGVGHAIGGVMPFYVAAYGLMTAADLTCAMTSVITTYWVLAWPSVHVSDKAADEIQKEVSLGSRLTEQRRR